MIVFYHYEIRVNPVGLEILRDRPRVNEETWSQQRLLALPANTFGY